MRKSKKHLLILGFSLMFSASAISAELFHNDKFRISGFGTLGLASSSSDKLGYRRDLTQKQGAYKGDLEFLTDSRIGIQLNVNLSPKFDAVVQFVAKERLSNNIDELLEIAFLGYRPNNNFEFRVGRLKTDIYMLSEYRDVGFAYLWARPIAEFYSAFPFQHVDGIDAQYSFNTTGGGFLQFKAFGGYTHIHIPYGKENWNTGSLPIYGFNLAYEQGNWQFRGGWAKVKFKNGDLTLLDPIRDALLSVPSFLWADAADLATELTYDNAVASFTSFGMAYDNGAWTVQSEIGSYKSNRHLSANMLSGYLSVGRRLGVFTPYVVASFVDSTEDKISPSTPLTPALQPLYDVTLGILNGARISQNAISFGTRWDISSHTALKFQWDLRKVRDTGLWNSPLGADGETVNTFSISLDFIF